ncbi:MAG TPA: histidine kinase dimerization/phosphoacceptor domain -containing protein [Geminicoccaceae bacterium]|nr:histidine kinase dimerization/phosphoacceptor domain -containing protein [Geminicoccaceae bacterium]
MIGGSARQLCDALPEVVFLVDLRGSVVLANGRAARLLGRRADQIAGRPLAEFVAGDPAPARAYLARCARSGAPVPGALRLATPRGDIVQQAQGAAVTTDDGARLVFLRCTEKREASRLFLDLNARLARLSDELYKRGRLQAELQRAVGEREVLLKEVHHRVRNNLQVITSFLNLQLRGLESDAARRALREAQTRIRTLGLIHGQLYAQDNLAEVDFAEFVPELCAQLASVYGVAGERVRFRIALPPWRLDLGRAVPLALLVTEAVTNALKYAFPGERSGTVAIELREADGGGGARLLRVADDGVGPFEGALDEGRRSLGLRLMHALAEQLDARLEILSRGGVEVRITLPDHPADRGHAAAPAPG